jgi:hypothetical protein
MTHPSGFFRLHKVLGATLLCLGALAAKADTYDLNLANASFTGGPNYASVDVENPSSGEVTFTLTDLSGGGVGIVEFGFDSSLSLTNADFSGLPSSWKDEGSGTMDGYGKFDYVVGDSATPYASTTITLTGLSCGTACLADFEIADNDGNYFAAHLKQTGLTGYIAANSSSPECKSVGCSPVNMPEASTADFLGVYFGLPLLGGCLWYLRRKRGVSARS